MLVLLSSMLSQSRAFETPKQLSEKTKANELLQRGQHLAELYNWADAATAFENAEKEFNALRDKRNALYAHLGAIRATSEQRNLPQTSAWLATELNSNPLLKTDKKLRLFCLIVKGDIDQEIDTRAARLDWEQVKTFAAELGNERWQNRALAQIGISAFYDRDLETARKNVATAVETAAKIHDVGAQIRFTTVLGMAFLEAKMYERALPYFDNALELAKQAPDSGFPLFTYEAQLHALVGLTRYDSAQQLVDKMLKQISSKHRSGAQAQILPFAAQIALARGHVEEAIADLEQSVAICKAEGYQQLQAEPEAALAELFRRQGNLRRAEYFAVQAAASSQSSGDKWSLPQRLQALAELQVAQGEYVEADRTYDKATAFIDSGLANSSSVLEKTALIKASGTLYPEHFDLVVTHLHNPAKAYSIVEQVRGRVSADLLMSGSRNSQKAKDIEHTISVLQLQMMSARAMPDVNRLRNEIFAAKESRWVTPGVSILKRRAQDIVPVDLVQHGLDSGTAILEYVVGEPRSYCLVISRSAVRIVPLARESKIDALVASYLKAVRGRLPAHVEARELFNTLLRPILEVEQEQNLVMIRDGQLHLLAFDALETSSGAYLLESHTVAYAPSVTSYYLLSRETARSNGSMVPLLGVGGIPYSRTALQPIRLLEQNGPTLPDLPYSKEEVLDANSTLAGKNTLLLGENATELAFKHAINKRYGTIHIAVHGFANSPDPDNASLALLPDAAAGEDGLLHASEIAMMHLDADLVVLSACDTAVGPIQGEEGISTLSNSFLLAGAKGVVSTLWSVQDASSLFLMQQLYLRIAAGDPAGVALARAKRQMLQKFAGAALPYYWAGFTFEGALGPQTSR
jgi:CHAT domain-containing protein/tetratricopeptide (TPR) repeat protein